MENKNKRIANMSIDIRSSNNIDLSYLAMNDLLKLFDKEDHGSKPEHKEPNLIVNAKSYKPIRDALMHTAILTDEAKKKLTSVYNEIRARIIDLLFKIK